jgi:hypothetical protein
MAVALLPEGLWDLIESLLAPPRPKPKGGRPCLPDRACLTGILFVLWTVCRFGCLKYPAVLLAKSSARLCTPSLNFCPSTSKHSRRCKRGAVQKVIKPAQSWWAAEAAARLGAATLCSTACEVTDDIF